MSDLDRYQYGYDQNSNRLYKANVVGTPIVSGGLDEYYSYDSLNRLTMMQRGTLNSGRTGISGTPSREMDYTLDPTGNWSAYLTKTNGTTDLNQTRTANKVNEITAIGGTPAWVTPPAYDAAGNMTSFPQPATPASAFTATYDAWNRMVSINNSSGSVATYQYDGKGRRIVKTTTGTGGQTRHFFYTNNWQDIEERVGSSTTMDKQYVWGARYVDELVCRDDATPQRLYATQDANFNLTSICNTSGGVVERYYYDPYGNQTIMNGSWGTISASAYSWVIGHQGLMLDTESGLAYARYRLLNPRVGLFATREPYKYFVNSYEFGNGSPINNVDPFGLDAAPCSMARMDELRYQYLNDRNTYYSGEPNPLRNLTINEVIQLSERAFWDECDRSKSRSSPSSGGSSAAMCCLVWGARIESSGACCELVPGPGTAIGTTDIVVGGVLLLVGGILYVCSKSKDEDNSVRTVICHWSRVCTGSTTTTTASCYTSTPYAECCAPTSPGSGWTLD